MSIFWSWWIAILTITLLVLLAFLFYACSRNDIIDSGVPEGEAMDHIYDEDIYEFNNPMPKWWRHLFIIMFVVSVAYLFLYPGLVVTGNLFNWASSKDNVVAVNGHTPTIQINQYEMELAAGEQVYGPIFKQYAAMPYDEMANNEEALKIGQRLFLQNCSQCHGSNARGGVGFPNLTDDAWLYGGTPEIIEQTLRNGRMGMMPARGGLPISNIEIDALIEYIYQLSSRDHDSVLAAQGQTVFMKGCFACHGMDGKGNKMIGAPNLTDKAWLYGGSRKAIKDTLLHGRMGVMPAWMDKLGPDKIRVVANYVAGLSKSAAAKPSSASE